MAGKSGWVLAGLAILAPSVALAQVWTMSGDGRLAIGAGAKVEQQADGRWRADNGKASKTCGAQQIVIASTLPTTITTLHGDKTYAQGVVACLDVADFGGSLAMDTAGGKIVLRPASTK